MGAKPAQSERKHPPHPPSPEALVALAFERFDFDSNVAINLEELEAVLDELHKNRPEPHPGRGPNEERPPKHVPPPLHRLFEEADAPTSIYEGTNIDEPAILTALAGLDLSGNEEGLIPRFGVMLTNHFANFYNRISFEFVRRMSGTGMLEMGEILLQDAGYQCAFNTFGGIMISDEWK
ncbi:MAG: hypothetical protein F6K19_49770, partial [Cyanothece sp. SIO1E1]|nr:hypothetical protein [Cyanothece sp. SIO1E1]